MLLFSLADNIVFSSVPLLLLPVDKQLLPRQQLKSPQIACHLEILRETCSVREQVFVITSLCERRNLYIPGLHIACTIYNNMYIVHVGSIHYVCIQHTE